LPNWLNTTQNFIFKYATITLLRAYICHFLEFTCWLCSIYKTRSKSYSSPQVKLFSSYRFFLDFDYPTPKVHPIIKQENEKTLFGSFSALDHPTSHPMQPSMVATSFNSSTVGSLPQINWGIIWHSYISKTKSTCSRWTLEAQRGELRDPWRAPICLTRQGGLLTSVVWFRQFYSTTFIWT
jgi:hypothetical protein